MNIFDNYLLKINKIITDNKKILKLSVLENLNNANNVNDVVEYTTPNEIDEEVTTTI